MAGNNGDSRATFRIWRGADGQGEFEDFTIDVSAGMVVLDAVHKIQASQANDMAVRWNCKAGKCGSCSAEINGKPRLMCMTRLNQLDLTQPVTVEPTLRTEPGDSSSPTPTAPRNSGNASSASYARTSVTSCAIITCTTNSSARASSYIPRTWK